MSRFCEACRRPNAADLVYCDFCGHELGTPYPTPRSAKTEPDQPAPTGPCERHDVDPGSTFCNRCGFTFPRRKPR